MQDNYRVKLIQKIFHPNGYIHLYKIVELPFPPYFPNTPLTLVDEYEDHIELKSRVIYYDIPYNEFQIELEKIDCKNKDDFDYVFKQYKNCGWQILRFIDKYSTNPFHEEDDQNYR